MVRYDDRFALKGLGPAFAKPAPARFVQRDGVGRCESSAFQTDDGKVVHALARPLNREPLIDLSEELKVRPKDATEESHVFDDYALIVEHVDIGRCTVLQSPAELVRSWCVVIDVIVGAGLLWSQPEITLQALLSE